MSEQIAIMPYSHYEGACNAIREATGKTDKIPSGQLEAELRNALASGGGESKNLLKERVDGTITEVTAQDLEGATSIKQYAFSNCSALSKLVLPDTVKDIGLYAIQQTAITEFICPASLTDIGTGVFYSCKALKKVVFNDGLRAIGPQAFAKCTALEELDFTQCTSIPTISSTNALADLPSTCIIKIRPDLLEEWKAKSNWDNFAGQMIAG